MIPFRALRRPRRRFRSVILTCLYPSRAIFLSALILTICFSAGCAHRAATANIPAPPVPSSANPPATSASGASSAPTTTARKSRGSKQSPAAGSEGGAGYVEEGVASWYGFPFQGRRTSDGEIYDMNQMVAAHRTLPFNTIVRVTNLRNGLQTEVRIIDRGPFVEGRIIDLSLAAAKALDIVATGTAPVRLEIVTAGAIEISSGPGVAQATPAGAPANLASPPIGSAEPPAVT
ncbi:MAG: septal ring lytic transglycosylase RlpA family protein, partial [Candidatus Acidiferrales bacterium]